MLKYFMKLTALVALVAFVGCDHQNVTPTEPKPEDSQKKKEEEELKKEEEKKKEEKEKKDKENVEKAGSEAFLANFGDKTLASLKDDEKTKVEEAILNFVASIDLQKATENHFLATAITNNVGTGFGDTLNRTKCESDRAKVRTHIGLVSNDIQKRLDAALAKPTDVLATNKDMLLKKMIDAKVKPSALVLGLKKRNSYNAQLAAFSCDKVTKEERKKAILDLNADEKNALNILDEFLVSMTKKFEAEIKK